MRESGLIEVENPSAMMLSGRISDVSGGCITCMIEGTRPILSEVQALVTTTGFGNPRRMSNGFDYNRLNMLLASGYNEIEKLKYAVLYGADSVYVGGKILSLRAQASN